MEYVELKCIKEGSKLRVRILSPGYLANANCQFPRDIRIEGLRYKVNYPDLFRLYLTEPKNIVFYPFGKYYHACIHCAKLVNNCPMCMKKIENR